MSAKNVMIGMGLLVAVVLAGGLIWFDRQFEEPDAKLVPSIAGEVGAKSVLAILAHPDDEQLITGLLIRAREDDGAITRIITATKGEAGKQLPQVARQEELGIIRHAEVLKNGYALGVTEQLVWDYPDGGMAQANFEDYVDRLQRKISLWQPDLVVTFWPESGFSGHPDHKTAGRAAIEAVARLQSTAPEDAPRAVAYILAPEKMMRKFSGELGVRIADRQPAPTHAMPGESWAKLRGWEIHASQRNFVQEAYGMPPALVHRLYDKEHYHLKVF